MSHAVRADEALTAAQMARADAEQVVQEAQAKHHAAKKAFDAMTPRTTKKEFDRLESELEFANAVLTAAIRERDAGQGAVRAATLALPIADANDRWVEADNALAPCKVIARRIIALQDQIAVLDASLAGPFRSYLECTNMLGAQADPVVEHEPGRPRFLSDLIREVRREMGQNIPDVALSTPKGALLAHLQAAGNARAQQDRARVRKPVFKLELDASERDGLLWVLTVRGLGAVSDMQLSRGLTQAQLYALADAPLPGQRVNIASIQPETLAEIANGLTRALAICAVPPVSDGKNVYGGPGKPFDQAAVNALRNQAKGWTAPAGAAAPKPDDRYLARDPEPPPVHPAIAASLVEFQQATAAASKLTNSQPSQPNKGQ